MHAQQCERAEEKVLSTIQFVQERVLQPTKVKIGMEDRQQGR